MLFKWLNKNIQLTLNKFIKELFSLRQLIKANRTHVCSSSVRLTLELAKWEIINTLEDKNNGD
jgi:hypothetical protein